MNCVCFLSAFLRTIVHALRCKKMERTKIIALEIVINSSLTQPTGNIYLAGTSIGVSRRQSRVCVEFVWVAIDTSSISLYHAERQKPAKSIRFDGLPKQTRATRWPSLSHFLLFFTQMCPILMCIHDKHPRSMAQISFSWELFFFASVSGCCWSAARSQTPAVCVCVHKEKAKEMENMLGLHHIIWIRVKSHRWIPASDQ